MGVTGQKRAKMRAGVTGQKKKRRERERERGQDQERELF